MSAAVSAEATPQLTVACLEEVPEELVEPLWQMYLAAFGHLRPLAAARQVLWPEEFAAEMADPRVWKYVAFDQDRPVGLTLLTANLQTVPWISPEYYAARFPEEAARGALYYVPFVCTAPHYERTGVFWQLGQSFITRVADDHGVIAWDICAFNNFSRDLAGRMAIWHRRYGVETIQLDAQNYYAASYGPNSRRAPRGSDD